MRKSERELRKAGPLPATVDLQLRCYSFGLGTARLWGPLRVRPAILNVKGLGEIKLMLRLVLDNNILNRLSGQAPLPANDLRRLRRGLKRKAAEGEWHFVGSCRLITEMLGIPDAARYSIAFSLYWDLIKGRVLKPWSLRVQEEMRLRRPLQEHEMLLDEKTVMQIYRAAKQARNHGPILDMVRHQKGLYCRVMKELRAQRSCPSALANGWDVRQWLEDSRGPVLDMFAQDLCPEAASGAAGPARPLTVQEADALPATRSLVRFFATKLYEYNVLGLKVRKGDDYDMSYYIDAVPDGYLVTEDEPLIKTCRRVPQRRMGVLRLKSVAALLGEWEIASKLRRCQRSGQDLR
jgi:hypothetical protein